MRCLSPSIGRLKKFGKKKRVREDAQYINIKYKENVLTTLANKSNTDVEVKFLNLLIKYLQFTLSKLENMLTSQFVFLNELSYLGIKLITKNKLVWKSQLRFLN